MAKHGRSRGGNQSHTSYGSPASKGASKGGGSVAGAGELPAVGPGPAAQKYRAMGSDNYPSSATPSGKPPKGMSTYREE